jgi:hypothetical protein
MKGVKIPGVKSTTVSHVEKCKERCFKDASCNYWSFGEGNCWLTKSDRGKVSLKGYTSGQQSCGAPKTAKEPPSEATTQSSQWTNQHQGNQSNDMLVQ